MHEHIILERFKVAIEKKKCSTVVKNFLNEAMKDTLNKLEFASLPEDIMNNILSNLNIMELKKMVPY